MLFIIVLGLVIDLVLCYFVVVDVHVLRVATSNPWLHRERFLVACTEISPIYRALFEVA